MKKKWFVRSCVVAAVSFAAAAHADSLYAQGTKGQSSSGSATEVADDSVLAVGLAPIDTLLPNVQHLARLIGGGQAAGMVQASLKQFTNGLDTSRPAGVFVELDESGTPDPIVCLPLKNFETFTRQLAIFGEPEDLGDGLYAYYLAVPVYLRNVDGWLVAGQSEDAILNFDPKVTENLKGLVSKYDLRIQVSPQNIPSELVDFFLAQIEQGFEQGIEQSPDLEEEAVELARKNAEMSVQNIRDIVEGTDKAILGLAISPKEKKTVLDLGTKFISGSKFSKQLDKYNGATSALSAVAQEESALSWNSVQFVLPEDIQQAESSLEVSLEAIFAEIDKKAGEAVDGEEAKKLIRRLVDLGLSSAREGKVESSFNLTTEANLNAVLAFSVADGKAFADIVADFNKVLLEKERKLVTVKTNVKKVGGGDLHRISIQLGNKKEDEVAKKIFGSNIELAVVTAPKSVYVAIGKDCESTVEQAVARVAAKPSAPASMITLRSKLSKLASFIDSIQTNPAVAAFAAATASGNDFVTVDSKVEGLDSVIRISVGDQVFKGAQEATKAARDGDGF